MKIMGVQLIERQVSKSRLFGKQHGKAEEARRLGLNLKEADKIRRFSKFVNTIEISGPGISAGTANVTNEFTMNLDTFDYDELSFDLRICSVVGWDAVGFDHEMVEVGGTHLKIFYAVKYPGDYILDIKFGGVPIPASPFKIAVRPGVGVKRIIAPGAGNKQMQVRPEVDGDGEKKQTQVRPEVDDVKRIIAHGTGKKQCITGQLTSFEVGVKTNLQSQLLVVADGMDVQLQISESKSGRKIQYLAPEEGVFFLRVKANGRHIPGSPFLITSSKKTEFLETAKNFFLSGFLAGGKEKKNDLQP